MQPENVEYREIDFTVGYRVGSDGTVWTRRNARWGLRAEWRRLKASPDSVGYPTVALMMPNKRAKAWRVHVLVLIAFRGPRPPGADGCHINGIPQDCRLENLRWDTRASNVADAFKHGTMRTGSNHPAAKLTDDQRALIKASNELGKILAARFNISEATICRIRGPGRSKHA